MELAAVRAAKLNYIMICKPTYEVVNTSYMVWYDYEVIKFANVFENLSKIGLTRKADIFLRLYFNTGTLNATVSSPNTATPGYTITAANNSLLEHVPLLLIILQVVIRDVVA